MLNFCVSTPFITTFQLQIYPKTCFLAPPSTPATPGNVYSRVQLPDEDAKLCICQFYSKYSLSKDRNTEREREREEEGGWRRTEKGSG